LGKTLRSAPARQIAQLQRRQWPAPAGLTRRRWRRPPGAFARGSAMSSSVVLPGSAFHLLGAPRPGHHRAGELSADERRLPIDLTLMLRAEPVGRVHPTGDLDLVAHWSRTAGLRVSGQDAVTRRLTVSGEADRLAELFGVR